MSIIKIMSKKIIKVRSQTARQSPSSLLVLPVPLSPKTNPYQTTDFFPIGFLKLEGPQFPFP